MNAGHATGDARGAASDQASRFDAARRLRPEHPTVPVAIVLWFLAAAVVQPVSPIAGFGMMAPVYVWVVLGRGARVLRGTWPASLLMEDVTTERGTRWLFGIAAVVHTAILAVTLTW